MLPLIPGATEAGLVGFALADALADLLVTKGVVTRTEIDAMCDGIIGRLSNANQHVANHAARFIRDAVLSAKSVK